MIFAVSALFTGTAVFADEQDQTTGDAVESLGNISASSPVILPDKDVSLTVYFDGKSALAVSATFEYPDELMEYKGYESLVRGFSVSVTERSGGNGVSYLDVFGISTDLVTTLSGVNPIISFDFHINKDAQDGAAVYLNMKSASASDGVKDYPISDLSYQAKVSLYDTTVPVMESVKINGKPLDGFSPDVSQYSVKVEYSVTVLTLDIVCQSGNTATVRGHENLVVGENTVFIEIVSETGNKHTYTVKVERLADPNHVISTDASLADIKLSAGFITPSVQKDVTDYVIYLPGDITELVMEPVTSSDFAVAEKTTVAVEDKANKTVQISVTAEDGSVCVYTFTLIVTPDYNGKIPVIGGESQDISKIDFGKKDGLYLPLPAPIEAFLKEHGIGGTEVLVITACTVIVLMIALAVILLVILKKKKNKKVVAYVDDSLEGAALIEKNGSTVSSDDDIESNVF